MKWIIEKLYYWFAVRGYSSIQQESNVIGCDCDLCLYEMDPLVHESRIFLAMPKEARIWSKPCNYRKERVSSYQELTHHNDENHRYVQTWTKLTVASNGHAFKKPKAILALKGWNFAMGKFGSILGFLIVNIVFICGWQVKRKTCPCSSSKDLGETKIVGTQDRNKIFLLTYFPLCCVGVVQRVPIEVMAAVHSGVCCWWEWNNASDSEGRHRETDILWSDISMLRLW